MINKIKTIIIGCGRIGYQSDKNKEKKFSSHFSVLSQHKNYSLIGVCDTNIRILKEIDKKHKVSIFKTINDIPTNIEVDLIVVATPDETHYKIIKFILKFSPKLIFVEKPITQNYKETIEIINVCKEKGIFVSTNFSRRFSSLYQNLKKQINIEETYVKKVINKFTGSILHNGVHFIDLALYFFGDPDKVIVSKDNDIIISFKFIYINKNIIVWFLPIKDVGASVEEIDIFLKNARIFVDNISSTKSYIINDPNFNGFKIFGNKKIIDDYSSKFLINAYENIFRWFNKKEKLLSPAENSLKTFKIIEDKLNEKISN